MKNLEKFPRTNDAIEAWDKYHDGGGDLPFAAWAEQEVAKPTLLEAAETVKNTWYSRPGAILPKFATTMSDLVDAIAREKSKPVRNFNRFATAAEALSEYRQMCRETYCKKCPYEDGGFDYAGCSFNWLYAEAEKDKAK